MWTSSYLPSRRTLALGLGLVAVLLGLLGLGWHLRRCMLHVPKKTVVVPEGIPVRLHIAGTPGACVRIDGQVVGPIPADVQFFVRSPQRVVVQACKSGFLDFAGELELLPGVDRTEHIWLPRYRLLRHQRASVHCPCQTTAAAPADDGVPDIVRCSH